MRYNQFSYIPTSLERAAEELKELGFDLDLQKTAKANLESFYVNSSSTTLIVIIL